MHQLSDIFNCLTFRCALWSSLKQKADIHMSDDFAERFDRWANKFTLGSLINLFFVLIILMWKFCRRKSPSTRLIIRREPYGGVENQLKLWTRKESIIKRNLKTKSVVDWHELVHLFTASCNENKLKLTVFCFPSSTVMNKFNKNFLFVLCWLKYSKSDVMLITITRLSPNTSFQLIDHYLTFQHLFTICDHVFK